MTGSRYKAGVPVAGWFLHGCKGPRFKTFFWLARNQLAVVATRDRKRFQCGKADFAGTKI